MAATLTTNSGLDNGGSNDCTLREAVLTINSGVANDCGTGAAGDTIKFSLITPATITLSGTDIALRKDVTIQGPGERNLTISGDNASRIFLVGNSSTASVYDMALTQGSSMEGTLADLQGGAILIAGDSALTLSKDACLVINDIGTSIGTSAYFLEVDDVAGQEGDALVSVTQVKS